MDTNNDLKSRLDMKDNSKCITISLTTSIGNHCFVGIEGNSGSIYQFILFSYSRGQILHWAFRKCSALLFVFVILCLSVHVYIPCKNLGLWYWQYGVIVTPPPTLLHAYIIQITFLSNVS